jgi:hypothetical protein
MICQYRQLRNVAKYSTARIFACHRAEMYNS